MNLQGAEKRATMARPRGQAIGLSCPKCGGRSTSEQTRHVGKGQVEHIIRYRECKDPLCKTRFKSREVRILSLQ